MEVCVIYTCVKMYVVSIGIIKDCLSSALTICQALNDDNAYVLWFNTHCDCTLCLGSYFLLAFLRNPLILITKLVITNNLHLWWSCCHVKLCGLPEYVFTKGCFMQKHKNNWIGCIILVCCNAMSTW